MAVLEIIQPDNPVLRKKAHKITSFNDPKLQQLIDDMVETMQEARGVGLAAPQVAQSRRLIIVRLPDESDEDREEYGDQAGKTYIVANPKIIKQSRETVSGVEGCLSIPGWLGEVERASSVVVTGQDRHKDRRPRRAHVGGRRESRCPGLRRRPPRRPEPEGRLRRLPGLRAVQARQHPLHPGTRSSGTRYRRQLSPPGIRPGERPLAGHPVVRPVDDAGPRGPPRVACQPAGQHPGRRRRDEGLRQV